MYGSLVRGRGRQCIDFSVLEYSGVLSKCILQSRVEYWDVRVKLEYSTSICFSIDAELKLRINNYNIYWTLLFDKNQISAVKISMLLVNRFTGIWVSFKKQRFREDSEPKLGILVACGNN